ncbi:toxic anion resistance protein [Arsenicicoccus sp. MKL-02]|uniref:Toxic anion resistance protein n=1 Tax=Arsenicicoccus cauae TaxID=2663847 RepID=A0A6I3IFS7_9MICO|nr:toxic anion resistance protein [Arsenicicoccus cauae]MTB72567.1 toxic anion resistance protein [Arsenicicoccus cauae]
MTEPTPLAAPEPVAEVTPQQAAAAVAVEPAVAEALRRNAAGFVQQLLTLDVHSPAIDQRVRDITTMGDAEVKASSQLSSRMLDRRARSGSVGVRGPEQVAGEQLVRLRQEVEALDPADLDKPARKLLGLVPMGDRVADYVERYYASQDRINMLILSLRTQQDELRKDNAAVAGERANLWRLMGQLQEYSVLAGAIDEELGRVLPGLEASDPARARVLRDQVQHAARQKHQDLLTHLAVCTQGYLALDLVRSNNELLVQGIDRAATTTLAALRTAVVVSGAVSGQRRTVEGVQDTDRRSAEMLDDSARTMRSTAGSGSPDAIARLKSAFGEVYAALDEADAARTRGEAAEDETRSALDQRRP